MENNNLTNSIVKIIKGKHNELNGYLYLTIELVQGILPIKNDYIFLKEEMYSIHACKIQSINKKFFKNQYVIKAKFPYSKILWEERINKYIIESGDNKVFCGISPEKYNNLNTEMKKYYVKSFSNVLGTDKIKKIINNNLNPAIRLIKKDIENKNGLSKIGGLPNLPIDMEYPKDESGNSTLFLAQIYIAELNEYFKASKELNGNGILYFFATIDNEDEEYPTFGNIIVKYSENISNLSIKEVPKDIKEYGYFKEYDLIVSEEINIPSREFIELNFGKLKEDEIDLYSYIENILVELNNFYGDKLLGYPEPVQECVLMEAELKSNKLLWYGEKFKFTEEEIEKTYNKIKPNALKWKLLYQFYADSFNELSNYDEEFNKYNGGTYFVLIKENDFNKNISIYQTS